MPIAYNVLMASHFIDNEWLEGEGAVFHSLNPATGVRLGEYRAAGADEVGRAVGAARRAFAGWSLLAVEKRAEYLTAFAEVLKKEKSASDPAVPTLPLIISQETGKPYWESLTEVDAMINKVGLSIQALKERRSTTVQTTGAQTTATRYKPHGVVAVLGPFNFPGHLPNGHIVPALLAGNTVVFKPSELTPGAGERMVRLWEKVGLPAGVVNMVQGARETGGALASHGGIDGLFFTGSVAAGRALSRILADEPQKILALEMGGNNPLVVWKAADLDAAALLTVQSAYQTTGQRCSCARRLIVENGRNGDALVDKLLGLIARLRIGPYTDRPEPFMGPLIRAHAAAAGLEGQQKLLDRGAIAIRAMQPFAPASVPQAQASLPAFVSPGVIDVTHISAPDEEIFAPLLQLIRVNSFEEAIERANLTRFGLCASLISDDAGLYERFFAHVRAGVINFNRPTTGASSALPFGGVGISGNHRPSAYHAADYCSYPIASMEQAIPTLPTALPVGIES
jgi:succinylglutamic semialdehyde dehydrogenase